MSKYKIQMNYSNGESEIVTDDGSDDEMLFDNEDDATEYALYLVSCSREGAEILHMSNPGDYEYDDDSYVDDEYEIIEVDD